MNEMTCTCGKPIPASRVRRRARFCTNECRKQWWRREYRKLNLTKTLPAPTTSVIAELTVALELMQRGYEVFRSLSSASRCDLAVLMKKKLYRVEVRTAYLSPGGQAAYCPTAPREGKF